jgi:ParG
MTTKTFSKAPKPRPPTPDEIAAFEKGGAGHDTRLSDPRLSDQGGRPVHEQSAREQTKRLSLDLPESKHRRFKTACSAAGHKMVEEIEAFIDARTAELEAEAGITRK